MSVASLLSPHHPRVGDPDPGQQDDTHLADAQPADAQPADAQPASPAWMDLAACKGRTPLFFPPKAERPQARERREARARRICDECPVFEECRQFARAHHEYGFWAGESEEDRHLAGFTVSAPIGVRARLVHR